MPRRRSSLVSRQVAAYPSFLQALHRIFRLDAYVVIDC